MRISSDFINDISVHCVINSIFTIQNSTKQNITYIVISEFDKQWAYPNIDLNSINWNNIFLLYKYFSYNICLNT